MVSIISATRQPAFIRHYNEGPRNIGKTRLMLGLSKMIGLPTLILDFESHDGVNPSSVQYAHNYTHLAGVIPLFGLEHPDEFLDALSLAAAEIQAGRVGTVAVDGLASLWQVTEGLASVNTNKFAAYAKLKPSLNRGLAWLVALQAHVLVTCMTTKKAKQEGTKVVDLGEQAIFSQKERIADRFMLATRMGMNADSSRFLQVIASKLDFEYVDSKDKNKKVNLRMGGEPIRNPGQLFGEALLAWANAGNVKTAPISHETPKHWYQDPVQAERVRAVLGIDAESACHEIGRNLSDFASADELIAAYNEAGQSGALSSYVAKDVQF